MRTLYSCLFYLLIPVILARLIWRGKNAPAYRCRWSERFAFYDQKIALNVIWFHAVSVGEAEALFPLARKMQQQFPDVKLLITTTTPTGSARVKAVMPTVEHVYLPYDIPFAVNRFMRHFKPKIAVFMETEIWPNLFAYCGKNKVPLYIINARLSEKSTAGYQKIPGFIASTLAHVTLIAAQTEDDASRFITVGARPELVRTLGNIKFDIEVSDEIIHQGLELKKNLFSGRYVWIIASTHKDEELIFLEIYTKLKLKIPELLLVIVPRHPERFDDVRTMCEQRQLSVVMRTSDEACNQSADVYLVDTMGELKMLYAAADAAFVGGSMVPVGGHNLLEAAAVGTPVLFGPFMANFKEIAEGMLRQQAAIQCQNENEIMSAIITLYENPVYSEVLVDKARQFVLQNQGAMTRIFENLIEEI
jgi:3-deoxy-D-manno-octulosonic-acid transferase